MQKLIIRTFVGAFLLAILLATTETGSQAQKASGRAENALAEMTTRLVSMRNDGGNSSSLADLARERYEMLEDLIESDPSAVLRYALPEDVIKTMPDTIRGSFEERAELEGDLEILAECEDADGRTLYFLRHKDGRLPLYFAKQPETELLTGDRVRVRGVLIGDLMAVEQDGITAEQKAATDSTESAITGEIKVLVFLVNFQNDTRTPYTQAQANTLMFDPSNPKSVTNYYQEASYGQAWVTGTTVGWYTLPMDASCATGTMASLARQAATDAGVNVAAYTKHMFVFPSLSCGWSGQGYLGGRDSFINNSLVLRTTAHELGHTIGLYHSAAIRCTDIVSGTCTTTEYGHNADMVGQSGITGHFHPYQKERLGWLSSATSSSSIITVQSPGNYTISALSAQDQNPKALRVPASTGGYYYVEFRRPVGFDSFVSSNASTMNGVLITRNTSGSGNYLLDMVPSTTHWGDAALQVGRSFTDPGNAVTITPVSLSSTGAVVNVSYGSVPCTMASPMVSANPSAVQWIAPGGTATYTVSVSNANSSGCMSNDFNVTPSVPQGWTGTGGSVTVQPGTSANVNVTVTAPYTAAAGAYGVALSAANAGNGEYAASVNASVSVLTSLSNAVATDRSVYPIGSTVVITGTVLANGAPVSGATVNFTIAKPSSGRKSSTVTATAVTGADGVATYRFVMKRNDPAGSYDVSSSASFAGRSARSATRFDVQ